MAQFSVSYAGVADVESRLGQLFKLVDGVASDLYSTAGLVDGLPSLENKGYARTLREHGLGTREQAEVLRTQGENLADIGHTYSSSELSVLKHLSERLSTYGFSAESIGALDNAIAGHTSFRAEYGLGRALDHEFSAYGRTGMEAIERFRYWRSTEGSDLVEKWVKKALGDEGMDNVVISEAIKDLNKQVEGFEDVIGMFGNFSNPDAMQKGGLALAGYLGIRGFVEMIPRYVDMGDAISNRAGEMWAQGDKGKAVCYALSSTTLGTFQFMGDAAWNSAKYVFGKASGNVFKVKTKDMDPSPEKRAYDVLENGTKKASSLEQGGLEGYFTQFGDWCWSRLNGAYGV